MVKEPSTTQYQAQFKSVYHVVKPIFYQFPYIGTTKYLRKAQEKYYIHV